MCKLNHYISILLFLAIVSIGFSQDNIVELENQLDAAKKSDDLESEASLYIQIGNYHVNTGKINKGQRHYNRSIRTNKNNQFPKLAVLVHRQYARSYWKENKYDDAIESYTKALTIARNNSLSENITKIQKELLDFQKELKKIKNAEEEYEKLKSMKKDDAIALLEKENTKSSEETDQFLKEINSLSEENQLKELKLRFKENQIDKKELKIKLLDQSNELQNIELEQRESEIALKNTEIAKKEAEAQKQRNIIFFSVLGIILLTSLVFVIVWNNKKQKKLNQLLKEKNEIIYLKNKETTDSIRYAKKIQDALLLSSKKQKTKLPESFILYHPKDIVSGDFYWIDETHDQKLIWTAADCTGHGVPGAFMSMIGTRLLNEIIKEKQITKAGFILDEMKKGVIHSLNQEGKQGESKDGMDIALCVWNPKNNVLEYAGANNSLYVITDDPKRITKNLPENKYKINSPKLVEIKSNRIPVGYNPYINTPFDTLSIQLAKGDVIYSLSDGFQDQFGGERFKKYTSKQMKRLMQDLSNTSMEKQKEFSSKNLNNGGAIMNKSMMYVSLASGYNNQ